MNIASEENGMKKNINMRKMKWFVIGVVMLCLLSGVLWVSLLQRTLQEYQVEGAGVMMFWQ